MTKLIKVMSYIVISSILLKTVVFAQMTPQLKVEQITTQTGGVISVPISITDNTGICGATITVEYDENLVLTEIEQGDALTTLTMTKPGNLSANPVNIGWDGMEADASNGVVAILTFTTPDLVGTYNINLSYEYGDIVDGSLSPIDIGIQNGGITIVKKEIENIPIIAVEDVTASPGESISVPVYISNNTGICGATISILYDENLVLTNISQGTALSSLSMTKPGNLLANPINIGWDGMEADSSNGIIATLTFKVPTVGGAYQIIPSYTSGDVVDGALQPVNLKMNKGQITVDNSIRATVKIGEKSVTLKNDTNNRGEILVAFYTGDGKLITVKSYLPQNEPINVDNVETASYAKVMWWRDLSNLTPLCTDQRIDLK